MYFVAVESRLRRAEGNEFFFELFHSVGKLAGTHICRLEKADTCARQSL